MRGVLSGSHLDGETGCCSLKWLCWHETPEKFPSLSSAAGETEDIRLRHLRNPASSVSSRWSAVMIKHERWMALIDLTGCLKTVFKQYRMETNLVNSWVLKNVPYNLMYK